MTKKNMKIQPKSNNMKFSKEYKFDQSKILANYQLI